MMPCRLGTPPLIFSEDRRVWLITFDTDLRRYQSEAWILLQICSIQYSSLLIFVLVNFSRLSTHRTSTNRRITSRATSINSDRSWRCIVDSFNFSRKRHSGLNQTNCYKCIAEDWLHSRWFHAPIIFCFIVWALQDAQGIDPEKFAF
jgi:hypothetical protein